MREHHPYGIFIPPDCRRIIIGSFPIGKFTDPHRRSQIKEHEIDFFFGGEKNLLWRLLGDTFGVRLDSRNAIEDFLRKEGIGMGDVIRSCVRVNGGASDKDLREIEWNEGLLEEIRRHRIDKVFFTSRGVEHWFRKLFPETNDLETIGLISPSAQSVRALGSLIKFQTWRKRHPQKKAYEFILESYKKAFLRD